MCLELHNLQPMSRGVSRKTTLIHLSIFPTVWSPYFRTLWLYNAQHTYRYVYCSVGVKLVSADKIHPSKQPRRPHYLSEWMERRNLTAAEFSREIGADKGLVSRWLDGASPGQEWQDKLKEFFGTGREGIFRHPDDDWLSRFFEGRKRDEIERIKQTLETAFPRRQSNSK